NPRPASPARKARNTLPAKRISAACSSKLACSSVTEFRTRLLSRHENRHHHRPRPAWPDVRRLRLEHLFALHPHAATASDAVPETSAKRSWKAITFTPGRRDDGN